MIVVIFLAGGKSTRMQNPTLKPFLNLGLKKVFEYSLELFLQHHKIKNIVVVADQKYHFYFSSLSKKIQFAEPGQERIFSVANGIEKIKDTLSTHIMVHDAARPFVSWSDLNSLIEHSFYCDGIGLAETITSTLKRTQGSKINFTVNRDEYVLMQTPQILKKNVFLEGIQIALSSKNRITDDLQLLELIDKSAEILIGSPYNFKLTYPKDLLYAEFLLKSGINLQA